MHLALPSSNACRLAALVVLGWAGLALAQPRRLVVVSDGQMELAFRTPFALVGPGAPLRVRALGPGRLTAVIVPARAGATKFSGSVEVEVHVEGQKEPLHRETVSSLRMLGLESVGRDFLPSGPTRLSFELLPKANVYELRFSAPAAVAAFTRVQAPPGVIVPDLPLKPIGRTRALKLRIPEKWHFASVCDRVRVDTPAPGLLRLFARPLLPSTRENPPPSFIRAHSDGKVRATVTITSAPELALEFKRGRERFVAGQPKTHELYAAAATQYEFEMAAWGCVGGVALQFQFEAGAPPPPEPEPEPKPAPDAGVPPPQASAPVADAGSPAPLAEKPIVDPVVQLDAAEAARLRALEYLESLVAAGTIPGSQLVLRRSSELGDSFLVERVSYSLDGLPLHQETRPDGKERAVMDRKVVPGVHTLEVSLVLRGRGSGAFAHLNDYVIRVKKSESFVADAGRRYVAAIRFEDRGGVTTPFKERPGVRIEIRRE